ncbi:MAG TPA: hypothetical protein DIW17_13725 [Clostridiales bacterium]|nr:hypothetical protein [Clostridiales bacterium]
MAMIKCPECGKDISDKAESCPHCGCPNHEFNKSESEKININNNENKKSEEYAQESYQEKLKHESTTGVFGNEYLKCPTCNSGDVIVDNDIPVTAKVFDYVTVGGVLPTRKVEHRNDMMYHCNKCGTIWNEEKVIKSGKEKSPERQNPAIPIILGTVSILLSLFFIWGAFYMKAYGILTMLTYALIMMIGSILSFCS